MEMGQHRKVVKEMIAIYYKNKYHQTIEENKEATELLNYVNYRLDVCPFQEQKKFCSHCSVHCYEQEQRELIRQVMRYSGPRLLFTHPILVIQHMVER